MEFTLRKPIGLGLMILVLLIIFGAVLMQLGSLTKDGIGTINEKSCGYVSLFCDDSDGGSLVNQPGSGYYDQSGDAGSVDVEELSSMFTNHQETFNAFAEKHNLEVAKLYAIAQVESRGEALDAEDHPSVRFECHLFNEMSDREMPCTVGDGGFSTVASQTNKDAFKTALDKDYDAAVKSSSFGFAQILGVHYERLGYDTPEAFYQAMFTKENQIEAFFSFLEQNDLIGPLRQGDWEQVARTYNGKNYRENNYHIKLAQAYRSYSSG